MPAATKRSVATIARPLVGLGALWLAACQPTVKIEAPDKPIVINMNVDVRVRLERDVEELIKSNPDIY
jgi:hypothetical protein